MKEVKKDEEPSSELKPSPQLIPALNPLPTHSPKAFPYQPNKQTTFDSIYNLSMYCATQNYPYYPNALPLII